MTSAMAPTPSVAFVRPACSLSCTQETTASMMDTDEVSAAKATITKNTVPTTAPTPPIASKILGREMNIRLGPALMPSVPMNVYTAGTIIRPARNATSVSKTSIWLTAFTMLVSFFT